MFFIFSKLLAFFVKPQFWLALLAALSWFFRKKKRGKYFLYAALSLAFLSTNEAIYLYTRHIYDVPHKDIDKVSKEYEYGILLSGMVYYNMEDSSAHFGEASDRLMQCIRLYKAGKIRRIIVSGGSASLHAQNLKEAHAIVEILEALTIDSQFIYIDEASRNTHENARNTAALLDSLPKGDCLLISSASHLPRANACFLKYGIEADLYATDPSPGLPGRHLSKWLVPSLRVMIEWQKLLHEWLGFLAYKVMGYC